VWQGDEALSYLVPEPYRIKVVEPINLRARAKREEMRGMRYTYEPPFLRHFRAMRVRLGLCPD